MRESTDGRRVKNNGKSITYICLLVVCFESQSGRWLSHSLQVHISVRFLLGPSRAFTRRRICHFFRQDIGKVGFKIAGNGMRYTHGTESFIIFLFIKRKNMK